MKSVVGGGKGVGGGVVLFLNDLLPLRKSRKADT